MPPIHPAIVHFPIVFLIFAFIADLIGYKKKNPFWLTIGRLTLAIGFFTAVLAAVAGYSDMVRDTLAAPVHQYVHLHLFIGIVLIAAMAGITAWRWFAFKHSRVGLGWVYFLVAFLVVALGGIQGWLGSELVYSYGAGVAAAQQGTEPPLKAQERLVKVAGRFVSNDEHQDHSLGDQQNHNSHQDETDEHHGQ